MYKFIIQGRPLVQKNDIKIRYKIVKGGKKIPFVDHSEELKKTRTEIAISLFDQFKKQGGLIPIDYNFEIKFVFYVQRRWEADLDNLPAIVLDAMQGVKIKGGLTVAKTIQDDKLLRKITAEKILEGDPKFSGELRTEIEIQPYSLED